MNQNTIEEQVRVLKGRSGALLEPGDNFVFLGLRGQEVIDPKHDAYRIVTVRSITTAGLLNVDVEWPNRREWECITIPLERAVYLVEQNVWAAVQD